MSLGKVLSFEDVRVYLHVAIVEELAFSVQNLKISVCVLRVLFYQSVSLRQLSLTHITITANVLIFSTN